MADASRPTETQRPSVTKRVLIVAVIVAAALGVGVTVAVARTRGHDPRAGATSAPTATWVQSACEDWMGAYVGARPPGSWCASMWSWMQSSGSGMMGMMWWRDPDQFRTACINRTGNDPNTTAWCNAMTTWMQGRASQYGGWGPWMMRPSP